MRNWEENGAEETLLYLLCQLRRKVTGAESWAAALILERAAKLEYPNIVVFDMHREYAPLADNSKGSFVQRFRIAGPGDLAAPKDDALFLPYWLLNRDEMLSMILDDGFFWSDGKVSTEPSIYRGYVAAAPLSGRSLPQHP